MTRARDNSNILGTSGTNGQVLTVDTNQSNGYAFENPAQYAAGKNKIINGDFALAQRGGTVNPSGTGLNYTLDRWRVYNYGSASTTVTQIAFDYSSSPSAAQAPITGYSAPYFARVNATTSATYFEQPVEDVRTFSGQTVTYSFWAKAASAVSGAQAQIYQYFGSGGSANVLATNINYNLTTSWQRITYTTTLPSVVGKTIGAGSSIGLLLYTPTTGVNVDFWGVQLEAGSVATPFTTASGTLQGELSLCQRYYQRFTAGSAAAYWRIAIGQNLNTTQSQFVFPLRTTMRGVPAYNASGSFTVRQGDSAIGTSAPILQGDGTTADSAGLIAGVSGATVAYGCYLRTENSTSAYLEFSAEL